MHSLSCRFPYANMESNNSLYHVVVTGILAIIYIVIEWPIVTHTMVVNNEIYLAPTCLENIYRDPNIGEDICIYSLNVMSQQTAIVTPNL